MTTSVRQDVFAGGDFDQIGEEGPLTVMKDLGWRLNKARLESENTQRFMKARPRFLPYHECRKWVIAIGQWDCEEDW